MLQKIIHIIPNQELSGAKSEVRTVGVCSSYKRGGQPSYALPPTFGLHHEACKCVYLHILISEAHTINKYE